MAFAVNTPKGQVRLMDLPLDVFCRIEDETGLRYVDVLLGPASTAKTATVVYRIACERTESEPEELTPAMLIADPPVFQLVDDDLPEVYEGGLPKSAAGQGTTGLSTAPDDSTGRPTSSDDSPSAT